MDSEPDSLLIDYFCDELFPNYNFNRQLLENWQVELEVNHQISAVIEEEIVLGLSPISSPKFDYETIDQFLTNLDQLSSVYDNFKIIMIETMYHILTSNYTTKIYSVSRDIHSLILSKLLQKLETVTFNDIKFESPTIVGQLFGLAISLLELGCPTKMLKRVLQSLNCSNVAGKLLVLQFMNSLLKTYPCHFKLAVFNSLNRAIPIPYYKSSKTKQFSIHSWFKLGQDTLTESITLLKFTSSNPNISSLSINLLRNQTFQIEIKNISNNSRIQFSFNQMLSPESYIHFVLTYDKYQNLNLFIDGNYSESIPCPDLFKSVDSWDKFYIGEDDMTIKNELLLRNLTLLDITLSPQWISLLYNLGLGYDWNFQEFTNENIYNLLNHLNYKGLVNLSLKIKELNGNKRRRNSFSIHKPSNKPTNIKTEIVNHLAQNNMNPSNIIFNSNDDEFLKAFENTTDQPIVIYHSRSVLEGFYLLGGTQLILQNIEIIIEDKSLPSAQKDNLLVEYIDLLYGVINNNWRLSREFENINGYGIISILLTNYQHLNKSLTLQSSKYNTLLDLILAHTGYDSGIIYDANSYRYLILNFDIFQDNSQKFLTQMLVLMSESKFHQYNMTELNKMHVLKKLIQFFKSPSLSSIDIDQDLLYNVLATIIKSDISVDTIKGISEFIIYSLYSDSNPEYGVVMLNALTDILCDNESSIKVLKKFSRSITIHWILLIMQTSSNKQVVICGIRLLSRLLKALGPNIIRKFFIVNRGLDILTHFLKNWWESNEISCSIYLAAFGIDSYTKYHSLTDVIESYPSLNKLVIPEFLNLLNNMVLNALYVLSQKNGKVLSAPSTPKQTNLDLSYDVLHLINSYTTSIELGYNKVKPLSTFYLDKDWLDGVFEVIGYTRLFLAWNMESGNFNTCYDRLVSVISGIFISKLFNNSFFDVFNKLSDFTKKLILDIIFPRIFSHINEFISVSNFIFNEREFSNEATDLLIFYNTEYIQQRFLVTDSNLTDYLKCILSVIEIKQNSNSTGSLPKLKSYIGDLLQLKLRTISMGFAPSTPSTPAGSPSKVATFSNSGALPATTFDEFIKMLLYRQMIILQPDVLNNKQLAHIVMLLLGVFFKFPSYNPENLFNLLRACYMMRQGDFDDIISNMTTTIEYSASTQFINDFFQTLITKNDEETMKTLKFTTYKHIFNQGYHAILGKDEPKLDINNMISVTLNNGGKLGQLDNIYIKSFERDCSQLKTQLIQSELFKFNRANQDQKENILYLSANYSSLKVEIGRVINERETHESYALDFIENSDRMRCRMIIENQLSDSEKLAYKIDVPIKNVDIDKKVDKTLDSYDMVIINSGIDTLSLSNIEMDDEDLQENQTPHDEYEDKNRKVLRSLYLGDHIVNLWNISQINGLQPIESLMILGSTHLYIIENYFHQPDGNVTDVEDAPMELRDSYLPLINNQSNGFTSNKSHRVKNWSLDTLSSISKRHFLLRDIALEMFFTDGASILVTCISPKERDSIYNRLHTYCFGRGLDSDLSETLHISSSLNMASSSNMATSFSSRLASAFSTSTPELLSATKKWKNGEMSNFYYLMIINTLAGRTFNDLTQYPVFPWVIADYTSETLDLSNPKTFRDLSKPMGAQNEPRSTEFKNRYEALDSLHDTNSPAFHYGTHYSSAMIVTSFLIRLVPYVHSYLLLQGGKFDHADRLFNSVEKAWISASRDNTTDVRELIPEFFYLPEFLVNSNDFELGTLQNGETPNNVVLPKWAKNDPKIFIQQNRMALESPYVSANLHLWIDLIFGIKQNGPEAVKALNVFHHLSYNGAIDLDNIDDNTERLAVIGMINNFGQTPNKIFHKPHPSKDVLNLPNHYFNNINDKASPKLVFESKLNCPIKKIEVSSKTGKWVGRPKCVCAEDELLIRKVGNIDEDSGSIIINNTPFIDIHSSHITCILQIGYKTFLTAANDGLINIWNCNVKPNLSLQFQGVLRGHICQINELKYAKSFKVGISSDIDGNVIVWDFVRFKFIRKFSGDQRDIFIDISNDTGNIGIVDKQTNRVQLFTLNGDLLVDMQLPKGPITSMRFGSINDPRIESGKLTHNRHTYWSYEIISFAYGTGEPDDEVQNSLEIYELKPDNNWSLRKMTSLSLNHKDMGDISAYELFKVNTIDPEDRLTRGHFTIIMGDENGRVFQW